MEVGESWHKILGLSSDEEGLREGRGAAAVAATGATAAGPATACHSCRTVNTSEEHFARVSINSVTSSL